MHGHTGSLTIQVNVGRQINYFVLPTEFPEFLAALGRSDPVELVPREQDSKHLEVWTAGDPPPVDGWLIRRNDLSRMQADEPSWWDARQHYLVSAGAFGVEIGACFFDNAVLRRARIYFNTLPPVDPDVARWASRVMSSARRWLLRQTMVDVYSGPLSIYCGPATSMWIEEARPQLRMGGNELVVTDGPAPVAAIDSEANSRAKLVQPFYLKMMRLNATQYGAGLVTEIATVSRSATALDVAYLLRSAWRDRVMGAWLALCKDDPLVVAAVLHALGTSQGSLDAPPLATAAVVLAGAEALPELEKYYAADQAHQWGAARIAAAAIDYLRQLKGVDSLIPSAAEDDVATFAQLMAVADALRTHTSD